MANYFIVNKKQKNVNNIYSYIYIFTILYYIFNNIFEIPNYYFSI